MPEERVRGPYRYYRVDYSLRVNGKVKAYLEVKSLGVNVFEDKGALHQLVMYCTTDGVGVGLLTNGIQWVVLKAYEKDKSIEERVILKIDLRLRKEVELEKLKLLAKEIFERDDYITIIEERAKELMNKEQERSEVAIFTEHPEEAKLLDELTPEELSGRPKKLELYIYYKGQWHKLPVERNAWSMSLFTAVKFLYEHGFQDLYIPSYVETTYVRNPASTDVIGSWYVYRPENGGKAVSKLKELEKKTGVKIAIKVVK